MSRLYYKEQLKRLKPDNEYSVSIKIYDGMGNSTNQMDLNLESIPVLIEYLKSVQDNIISEEQD